MVSVSTICLIEEKVALMAFLTDAFTPFVPPGISPSESPEPKHAQPREGDTTGSESSKNPSQMVQQAARHYQEMMKQRVEDRIRGLHSR